MKRLLEDLIALQEVEVEIFKAESGLGEIPKEMDELESILIARRRALDAVEEEIKALEQRKQPLEAELEENQAILTAADARIKKIKTNREYLALQREMDIAKKRKVEIEEEILYLMDKIETNLKEKQRLEKSFEEDKKILEGKKEGLISRKKELEKIIKDYKEKASGLRKAVDPSLLDRYDRIKKHKKGLAVVSCDDGVCSGCHMHIPPQLFNEIIKGDRLIQCPLCQRILYTNYEPGETKASKD